MPRGCAWARALLPLLLVGCSAGAEPARRQVVEIRGFQFVPAAVRVAPGDTVVWVNRDAVPHTATAAAGGLDTGDIPAGASRAAVAGAQGIEPYVCAYHPGMRARLDVRGRDR